MKRIAVSIDGVIRNLYDNFHYIHEEYIGEEGNNVEQFYVYDDDVTSEIKEEVVKRKVLNLNKKIDPYFLTHVLQFRDKEEFLDFETNFFPFELYANCDVVYNKGMQNFNSLVVLFNKNKIKVDLISREKENARFATLMFLSREQFKGNGIIFYEKISELNKYDMIITTGADILEKYNHKCLKINTKYNQTVETNYNFNNIEEVLNYYEEYFKTK